MIFVAIFSTTPNSLHFYLSSLVNPLVPHTEPKMKVGSINLGIGYVFHCATQTLAQKSHKVLKGKSAKNGKANAKPTQSPTPFYFDSTSLSDAVADYFTQECITNTTCAIITKYGAIGEWFTSEVTDMSNLFDVDSNSQAADFNESLNNWDVSNVTAMYGMFSGAKAFNQPLAEWNVGNVRDMNGIFYGATAFNQPLEAWNVGIVDNMSSMFNGATAFNQPLKAWNVDNVVYMGSMFAGATTFNQPLAKWNVGKVTSMYSMFDGAEAFNQPLAEWNVGNVVYMNHILIGATVYDQPMFSNATAFNQDLCAWGNFESFPYGYAGSMFKDSGCTFKESPTQADKGPFCASECEE